MPRITVVLSLFINLRISFFIVLYKKTSHRFYHKLVHIKHESRNIRYLKYVKS